MITELEGKSAPPAEAPTATRNLSEAIRNIETHGLAVIPEVLSGDALKRTHEALYRAAESDRTRGREQAFGLDYAHDKTNQRVWNVLSRDPLFEDMAFHPMAVELVASRRISYSDWPALRIRSGHCSNRAIRSRK